MGCDWFGARSRLYNKRDEEDRRKCIIDLITCWTESDLKLQIAKALPKCRAVQFSDYIYGDRSILQRAVPGDGVIPLERLVGWVLEAGYTGAFDMTDLLNRLGV